MGERERNQSYYGRNEGRHEHETRDDSPYREQSQHSSRDWGGRDDYQRSQGQGREGQGREAGDHYERNFGAQRNQDERDHNARGSAFESRRYAGNFGSNDDHRYGSDWDRVRRFETESGYGPGYGRGVGRDEHERSERSERNWQGQYGERSRPFGFDRSYGRESPIGHGEGLYQGSEWSRIPTQNRYAQRDWSARGNFEHEGYRGGQRDRDEDTWGQQLRDVGNQVARKVKRVFRGPKGYKRSDERIREDVSDRLALQDHIDPSEIEVNVSNGEVTLTGTVQSRHEKFLVEEIADDVAGVNDVHNQLRVQKEQHASQGGLSSNENAAAPGAGVGVGNQNANEAARRNARA